MGASSWCYVVPYKPDLASALADLHTKVFGEEDYYWYHDDERPSSIEELWNSEGMMSGTHSILDVVRVLSDNEAEAFGAVRPLTADERLRFFGTETPSRAAFDAVADDVEFVADPERWAGRCVVLYRDGSPDEIAFWGNSGD